MNDLSAALSNVRPREPFVADQQLLALLRRLIQETKAATTQSRARIALSRDAIAMLDQLQGQKSPPAGRQQVVGTSASVNAASPPQPPFYPPNYATQSPVALGPRGGVSARGDLGEL